MADLTPPEGQPRMLAVTSVRDGYEHLVAEEAMTPGSAGRYLAMCGHAVWAAVLACPAGPPCAQCVTIHGTRTTSRRAERSRLLTLLRRVIPARLRRPRQAQRPLPDVRLPQTEAGEPRHRRQRRRTHPHRGGPGPVPPPPIHRNNP